ncbi:hypothetical protein CFAM422_013061 [Trichoderma lentiforme]|uniref:Uncharacterized protein n=1 Tax=Trichoderma lentiforme TaxID=1567552 RepID=A0A9P5C5Y2_9HYPO|nr:hypothetical protein CFAM422_013061 [Trichoderma lentiforme]
MGEFELGAASLSWHCTVSGSEVNLAASKSYGHGPDCCISFLTQPYSPKSSTDRHSGSGRQMNRVGLFVGHHDALSTGDRLQQQGLWLKQMGCSSANELFLKSYDGGSLLVDQICILDEGGLGWDSVK